VIGPRISDVGTREGVLLIFPDIEEQPFHALDLVGSWNATEHFKFKLKVKNILFRKREFYQGDALIQRVDPGVSCTVGMSYSE
jgi:hypothetical protein